MKVKLKVKSTCRVGRTQVVALGLDSRPPTPAKPGPSGTGGGGGDTGRDVFEESLDDGSAGPSGAGLALIMYTSGTTGKPTVCLGGGGVASPR